MRELESSLCWVLLVLTLTGSPGSGFQRVLDPPRTPRQKGQHWLAHRWLPPAHKTFLLQYLASPAFPINS